MSFLKDIKGQIKNKSIRQLVANFRTEYISDGIDEANMSNDPILQFEIWFNEAVKNKIPEPNIMHLSTVTLDCKPSGRVLLLKGFDEKGFVIASMTFLWIELYRQVRIEGKVEKISAEESDQYFHSRPRGSQISAVASSQSSIIENRKVLEEKVKELEKEYESKPVPRPENWGGYCLSPVSIEFWQGRASRLHDRILFTLEKNNNWIKQRLAP